MVLRESGRMIGKNFNLRGLVEPGIEIGVDGGNSLAEFADALLGDDRDRLNQERTVLAKELGGAAVAAASLVAGCFSKNDRLANCLGLPLEPMMIKGSEDFRESLGINAYPSAVNSLKA